MHFEVLVEDLSGKKMLELLIPKIIGDFHTFKVHSYRGIGHIPRDLHGKTDPQKRILLDRLPKLLRGYGRTFANYQNYPAVVIVVCDLDKKCLKTFRNELLDLIEKCDPAPITKICFAIEEGEAWLLGDKQALLKSYPKANKAVLATYEQDNICGTWEKLADTIYPGGSQALLREGWQTIGAEKSKWASDITPFINIENNQSPSFQYFLAKMKQLSDT